MTATVHATYAGLNGHPATGQVVFEVNTTGQVVRDPAGRTLFQGPLEVRLIGGELTITLPPSDGADVLPLGFTFTATEQLDHVDPADYRVVEFQTLNGQTVELATLVGFEEIADEPTYGTDLNRALALVEAAQTELTAHEADHANPHAVTKAQVGLGLADNTPDSAKPVSTLQAAAISAAVNALVNGAPGLLDTLNELAAALADDPNFATTIATALAGKQPLDTDLTSIAALTTTAFGRAFLTLADQAAARTAMGLGSAATQPSSAFDAAGTAAAAVSALVAGAPAALDTLNELAVQLGSDESAAAVLTTLVTNIRNLTDATFAASLSASFAPKWKPSTAYTAGDVVQAPDGSIVKRLTSGTSGSSYTSANWQTVATVAGTQAQTELAASIAAGADARTALSLLSGGAIFNSHAAWAGADLYVDFTTKANGDPPSILDTGQSVDFTINSTGMKPQISSGKLIHGTLPGSGTFADYFQAQADGDVRSGGARFTVNSGSGSTAGILCLAAWASDWEVTGPVPQTPAHITIDTVAHTWEWFVSDGGGTGATHLKSIKQGNFTPPASDGSTVWELGFYIDPDSGVGYLSLPGIDAVTGTRYVTLTNAEIAAFLTAVGLPVVTFAQLLSGATVLMAEHYAVTAANTAIFPELLTLWGETRRRTRDTARGLRTVASAVPSPVSKAYAPTTQQSKTITTSLLPLYTDTANTVPATVTVAAGPLGVVDLDIGLTIEFGGSTSRKVTDGAIASGSATFTSATLAAATTEDVGSMIRVVGAGPSGGDLITTVLARPNTTTFTLADNASTTVSGAVTRIFTPMETIVYARASNGTTVTTPNPDGAIHGRAGQSKTVTVRLHATGQTPNAVLTWTLHLSMFSAGDGTATVKFGGTGGSLYPSLRFDASPK